MHLSRMDKRYILGVSNFIADAKADVKDGNSVFYPCKDWINQRKWEIIEYVRMHLITRGSCQNIRYGVHMGRMLRRKTMMTSWPGVANHLKATPKASKKFGLDIFI